MAERIPNYALYGEPISPAPEEMVHVAWLPESRLTGSDEVHPHRHDALLQLIYLREGSIQVSVEGVQVAFQAPCIIFLPCGTVHAFRRLRQVRGIVVTAAQRPLEALLRITAADVLSHLLQPAVLELSPDQADRGSIWPLLLLLDSELKEAASHARGAATNLLATVLIRLSRSLQSEPSVLPSGRHAPLLQRFRQLLEKHFRDHWTLDFYAGQLDVTPSKLARVCRETLGRAPLELANARMMREAKRQLAYTDASIKQIAHSLGFTDTSYFSRFFRKNGGVQPMEFRRAFKAAGNSQALENNHD